MRRGRIFYRSGEYFLTGGELTVANSSSKGCFKKPSISSVVRFQAWGYALASVKSLSDIRL